MDESNDKCNWKKVFKKFLEPPKSEVNADIPRNNTEESVSVRSYVDQENTSESSLISCSPRSNDSGYIDCKHEFDDKLPSETHYACKPNQNISQASDYKQEFNNELHFKSPPSHELNMNISKTSGYKSEFYFKMSSKKLPSCEFNMNTFGSNSCKPEYNSKLSPKMLSQELNGDMPQARGVPESNKLDNFHNSKVPEWNKAFKSILRDNSSSMDDQHQNDIYHSKVMYQMLK